MFNRIIKMGLLILFFITISSLSLFPIIKTRESEEYYSLFADNLPWLHWKLKRALITDNHGKKFVAKTDWAIAWQVDILSNYEICFVSDATVDVSIKYTYPKWSDIAFAPSSDRRLWSRFIDALRKHEEGHAFIGKEAGAMIEKTLLEVQPAANCIELETIIRHAMDVIQQEYNTKDAAYDEETMHGKNQGAVLP